MRLERPISWLALAAALIALVLGWRHFVQPGSGMTAATAGIAAHQSKPTPEVPIQDGKTIDFSTGKPIVKDSAEERAIIDAAVKEMDAASKDATFIPTAVSPREETAVDPATLPPKP